MIPPRVHPSDLVDYDLSSVMLDPCSLRVGGACQNVDSPALCDSEVDRRQQRPDPEIGAERHGVCCQRRPILQVSGCVPGHGRADVTSFDIQQTDGSCLTDVFQHPFQHCNTGGTESLEKG